ncbi:efflux RND transporter permease subunit [Akkermansiaceae bacterium]|nr:efflux RND transporter permease subunit [Akkermansiaceae bacterium]MDB4537294.1 efflux RND transporter permease subunit [Akkermansiaceae bacterium]
MIRWFTKNDIASNFLLVAILLGGVFTAFNKVPLEVQPTYDWGEVDIKMTYRGGSPKDVEEQVVMPINRVLQDLSGIKRVQAHANRGSANFDITPEKGVDLHKLRDEIEARVDTINTFPPEAERPRITVPHTSSYKEVLTIAITGNLSDLELYRVAKKVETDILDLPEVSRADLRGSHPLEIGIEADDEKLRDYGLTIQDLSDAIRQSSLALSAGSIRTPSGSIMIRTDGQAYDQKAFGEIVVTAADGALLKISDLATISDGFEENEQAMLFNGSPAIMIDVLQGENESAIKISDAVKNYIAHSSERFPEGIDLFVWDDESIRIRGRLSTLGNSLLVGALLVLIVLGLFLRPMLAFWVVLGIPVSFAGGIMLMPYFGLTANTMSIFAFIIVLGIVVDDAIVTGENIYSRLSDDLSPLDAAVLGTKQVATPVTFGAITTIVAFLPLMFLEGRLAVWAAQIPPVVGTVLVFSLVESKFILPSHLKHLRRDRDSKKLGLFSRFQKGIADGLERFVEKFYAPVLSWCVRHRYTTCTLFLAFAMAAFGYKQGGHLGFEAFPSIERSIIFSRLKMVQNTPFEKTQEKVAYITDCARELQAELIDPGNGKPLIKNILSDIGSARYGRGGNPEEGHVYIEILPPSQRSVPGPSNDEIAKMWQERVGELSNVENFRVEGSRGGRRSGGEETESLEVQLRGPGNDLKVEIAEEIEDLFEKHEDLEWGHADNQSSREELSITLKPRALELGITQRDLARQVRQAFYGEEAQRIQRDGDELRVIVRLPREKRESLQTFETLNIKAPGGTNVPFFTVANAELSRAPGQLELINGAQVSSIYGGTKTKDVDIMRLALELEPEINKIVARDPDLSWIWEGDIKENREADNRTNWLFACLVLTLYALLAIPFKSLLQPLIVLLAIPFGIIGAYGGHIIMDITPSWLSVFGILALAGVVVNDSLVLVDFINKKREEGLNLHEAVHASGVRRFRPIFLTSITTFAGLIPLMFDRAIHAQLLKPMAISLGYGILFATFITLLLIPAAYLMLEDAKTLFRKAWIWYRKPFQEERES